jgi:hypothetical protein
MPKPSTFRNETVKLLENTFRMVNIGLVKEFALVCHKLGLNVWLRQRPSAGAVSSAAQQLLPGKAGRRAKTKGDATRAGETQSRSGEIQSRAGEIQSRAGEIQDQSSSEGPSARAEHYAERAVPSAVPSTAPSAWRPSQPPPRPTLASPGAQLSDGLRERPW